MTRKWAWASVAVMGLSALTACGPSAKVDGDQITVNTGNQTVVADRDGNTATITSADGTVQTIANNQGTLPDFLKPYPGATETQSAVRTINGIKQTSLIYTTTDTPKAVLDHYKAQLEAAKRPTNLIPADDGGGMLSAAQSKPMVSIMANPEGGKTQIAINITEMP